MTFTDFCFLSPVMYTLPLRVADTVEKTNAKWIAL